MENSIFFFLFFFFFFFSSSLAQQPFVNNLQFNCYVTNASSTLGYTCNGPTSCSTYLTFRSTSPYQSPVLISYLLNTNASALSELNSVKDVSPIPLNDLVLVPATCHCDGKKNRYYQHNATYKLQSTDETYLIIANNTYQGLSTCQALIAQNPYDSRNLTVGSIIAVPLRCACPTKNQTTAGVKYLLNYLIVPGDDVPTISKRFGADYQSVLDANSLTSDSVIYPYNTLLLPIKNEPTLPVSSSSAPSPSPPSLIPSPGATTGGSGNSSSSKWVFVGVGLGVGLLILSCVLLSWYFCCRTRIRTRQESLPVPEGKNVAGTSSEYDFGTSEEVRGFLDSLMVYKFGDLEKATGYFDEEHRIQGSVYRGSINGDDAAVKRMKGDVSKEINILKQINHSNVVRLSGFCVHQGNTYLVYEFVENGSLSDWLHHHRRGKRSDGMMLSWNNRVRIAYDVAGALNYLHNYTNPPYVHKDIKSSNILLDAELRAKVANFGLARAVEEDEAPQLTRHVVGTQGYMAPEYLEHGLVTPKLDVYAFGVVILELLSGKEASYTPNGEEEEEEEGKGELFLSTSIGKVLSGEDVRSKLKEFIDPLLRNEYPSDLAYSMAEVAMRCVAREAGSRPATSEVLMALTAIYNSTLDWDPSDVGNHGSMIHGR